MARRKYSDEEVRQWEEEHHQTVFYINSNDSNLFVRRYLLTGRGWTVNLANPVAWIIVIVVVGLIVGTNIALHAHIFG